MSGRLPGEAPPTLLDYFPQDYLLFIDESHQTVPQLHAMYHGDRSRKQTLVNYGFRMPSALDNRPLNFEEFEHRTGQVRLRFGDAGAVRADALGGSGGRAGDSPDGPGGPANRSAPGEGPGGRSARGDSHARRTQRTRARHHADQTHGRRPRRIFHGDRRALPLHALGNRYARARAHPARPAPRRIRRPDRHQPAARRPRPAGSFAGRDPRRRQGRLPAQRDRAHSDDWPLRAARRRPRDPLRRPHDRLDGAGHRGNQSPPREASRLQRRERHHAACPSSSPWT